MLLSVCIPTIVGRETQFESLHKRVLSLTEYSQVEVISIKDNKEISIGVKRQQMLDKCTGKYVVMIDDDDNVTDKYFEIVLKAISGNPDCISYLEFCKMDGRSKIACHSNMFKGWGNAMFGYDYVRTPFCKDVIKTDICRQIGFKDMRFGEDHDFSIRLKKSGLIVSEYFINDVMYLYHSDTLNLKEHNERYGIK